MKGLVRKAQNLNNFILKMSKVSENSVFQALLN